MEAKTTTTTTQFLIAEKEENSSIIKRNHKNNNKNSVRDDDDDDDDDEHFHVLAVDDSVIERKMLEKLLTISSYHVTCVESGDKALEYLGLIAHADCHTTPPPPVNNIDHHHIDDHHHHVGSMIFPPLPLPDDDDDHHHPHHHQQGQGTRVNLIMTDYSMPGMSGYDLLKRVKESSWKDVPVVVMSSENVPSRIHMCLEEGAEEFLLKPVRMSDLKKLQPHILKSTPTTSEENSTILAAIDNNNKIFKEEITTSFGDNHDEDCIRNPNEGQEKGESQLKIDIKNLAMIDQL